MQQAYDRGPGDLVGLSQLRKAVTAGAVPDKGVAIDVESRPAKPLAFELGIEPLQAVNSPYNQVPSSFPNNKPSRARARAERNTPSANLAPGKSAA